MMRVRVGGAVLVVSGVLMAVGVFVASVHVESRLVTNRYTAAEVDSNEFSSWTLFTRCDRRSVLACEVRETDRSAEVDIDSASAPHGLPLLVIAATFLCVGVLACLTGTTNPRRALLAWGGVVCTAIAVGFVFGAIDGTMREFDVGHTTSGIWVLLTAIAVALVGAMLITRFERYGSPHWEKLAAVSPATYESSRRTRT
jgi:hypothetical protein